RALLGVLLRLQQAEETLLVGPAPCSWAWAAAAPGVGSRAAVGEAAPPSVPKVPACLRDRAAAALREAVRALPPEAPQGAVRRHPRGLAAGADWRSNRAPAACWRGREPSSAPVRPSSSHPEGWTCLGQDLRPTSSAPPTAPGDARQRPGAAARTRTSTSPAPGRGVGASSKR